MSQDFRPVIKEMLADKDAEIERLLTKSEKDKNTLLVSLEAATKEIERLKLAVHNEKQYAADLITTLRCEAEDKDTEIERLQAKVEAARVELRQQWERMQKENLALKNSLAESARQGKAIRKLEECNDYLMGRVLENNQLITELCDALDRSDPIQISIQEVANLIQRAREVTK